MVKVLNNLVPGIWDPVSMQPYRDNDMIEIDIVQCEDSAMMLSKAKWRKKEAQGMLVLNSKVNS